MLRRSLVAAAAALTMSAGLLAGPLGVGAAPPEPRAASSARAAVDVDSEATWRAALSGASTSEPNSIVVTGSFTIAGTDDPTYNGGAQPLSIEGNGFTIDGDGTSRVLNHNGTGAVTITNLTVVDGVADAPAFLPTFATNNHGGAIVTRGPLTIVDSTFRDNRAEGTGSAFGGAVSADGPVVITGSTFTDNTALVIGTGLTSVATAQGGAVMGWALVIEDSELSGNRVAAQVAEAGMCGIATGGAAFSATGLAKIDRSTFTDNVAEVTMVSCTGSTYSAISVGGALYGQEFEVEGSTFDGNSVSGASSAGGAVQSRGGVLAAGSDDVTFVNSTAVDTTMTADGSADSFSYGALSSAETVHIVNSTITGSSVDPPGWPASVYGWTVNLSGSVLADASGDHCSLHHTVISGGYNVVDDTSCGLDGSGDVQGEVDPLLGPLQANGGPTPTRAPLEGSPLLDTTPTDACFTETDQRGRPRPDQADGDCDTGAVEVGEEPAENIPPVADAGADRTVPSGSVVSLDGSGSSDLDEDELTFAWTQTSGPSVVVDEADRALATFTAPTGPATLGFELTVDDGRGGTDTDTVVITVEEALTAEETYVDYLYRVVLGRDGDPVGIEYWGARIEAGTSREQVARHFLISAEATRGRTLDQRFLPWLGRRADTGARDHWTPRLTGGQRILDLEISILASPELRQRAGGTDAGHVTELYRVLLGWTPTGADLAFWESRMASRGPAVVAREILSSAESARRRVSAAHRELLDRAATAEERTSWAAVLDRTGDLRVVEAGVAATWDGDTLPA